MLGHQGSILLQAQSLLHLFRMQIKLLHTLCNLLESMLVQMTDDLPSLIFWSLVRNILEHCNKYRLASENIYWNVVQENYDTSNRAGLLPSHHGEECDVRANSQEPWEAALATGKASAEWENSSYVHHFATRNQPKINEQKLSHELYLLREVGVVSSFNSFCPGKRRNMLVIKLFQKVQWWKD
jgi:hypothetical protein